MTAGRWLLLLSPLLLSPLLAGCGGGAMTTDVTLPVTWDEFAQACPKDPAVGPSWPLSGEGWVVVDVDVGCLEVVGQVLGLDWDSFGAEPADAVGDTTAVGVVANGFLIAVRSGDTPLSELYADGVPDELSAELQARAADAGLSEEDPAGQAWFALLTDHIDRVRYDPESLSGCLGCMSYGRGTVIVGDMLGPTDGPPHPQPLNALGAAGLLVHEASHDFLSEHHIPCVGTEGHNCDADAQGAYGASNWWWWTWIRPEQAEGTTPLCTEGSSDIYWNCVDHILDPGTYPPCQSGAGNVCD